MDRPIVTCEHGGNRVPPPYRPWFSGHAALLASHRGHDAGALAVARDLARALGAPLFLSTVSRLVIDLNRSIGHPRLYSEATRPAPPAVRREILARHYLPYRERVADWVAGQVARGHRVVHVSSHSFTPVLDGETRNADVGLLYDPGRAGEARLCLAWQAALRGMAGDLKVRRNYPYTGRSDGLTAWLRRHFAADRYLGIELEVNQKHVLAGGPAWRELRGLLVASLRESLGGAPPDERLSRPRPSRRSSD
ncbi:MAG: N-formylglutamate amidohydrolase [Thiobacillaceae bacterium]|jgi:predicted N-formylglutamate amidohydrolase|nr:N-formylglutamate amidohydrolase [Thiobacillaceae bacterium]